MWAKTLLLSAIVATSAVAAPVSAHQRGPAFQVQNLIPAQDRGNRGQDIRPLREVVDSLRGRYGGELISARLEDGARPVYVLRWRMPDGEVRDFRVDAVR
ncbi:PepSY domain-containing protein [Terricaulis silvestris]|uniref:PepSY domain-containing protein n=1 Tax=Terricaulis silvestris TaxID=2686094 RepID=A0A6I6MWK5_9CAUL|nr:hypothetical protein [Terricaulis silvestris]QGZ95583.1 hypothetical protein DSM104635_02433 [Terricaulis silvestris]